MKRKLELPPVVRRLTSGRWPFVWIALLTLFGVAQWVVPPFAEGVEARRENAQERELVGSYRTLAAQEPAERAQHESARAWWTSHGPGRARGATMASAATNAQERLRGILEGAGCSVMKLESAPAQRIADSPRSGEARLSVQFAAERVESLAGVLLAMESPPADQPGPYVRVANLTVSRSAYSAITGVIVDAEVHVWLEPAS